ncbi:MAG: (d)CMP kinase [Pseudomonadota bacterium]
MRFTVAIDGPAGAGKGTIAREIAARFGLAHLDTGLLYRAVGRIALDQGRGTLDEGVAELVARDLKPERLERNDLRSVMASRAASRVAAMPGVRSALRDFQSAFARREGGAVLDGRDIGTVICPEAEVKLFVTADAPTRAHRRFRELTEAGRTASFEAVLAEIEERDRRDSERVDAPLAEAPDAHRLDTTELSIEDAVAEAVRLVETRLG